MSSLSRQAGNQFQLSYILQSGQFDLSYYSHQVSVDFHGSLEAAVRHYLEVGQFINANPAANFDAVEYSNTKVYRLTSRGLAPFCHFVASTPEPIAIHIHSYYVDVLEELILATMSIKERKRYYVSLNSDYDLQCANSIFDKLGINQFHVDASVCSNRGRNFGPMLLEFRKKIARHQLLLHLHTKKSLRTGKEQNEWRMHNWQCLCGNEEISSSIIKNLKENTQIGLIGPYASSSHASYWWRRWLSVGHLYPDFFNRLSISKYQTKGVLYFPIGGMFWAKTAAIMPLLQHEWKYTDFPEEPCPDDGTLPHVIERSLAVIAEDRGFSYVESMVTQEKCELKSPSALMDDYISNVDYLRIESPSEVVVSFDFFDTLFTRHCYTPSAVHSYVGHLLQVQYNVADAYKFKEFRSKAEANARKEHESGEVGIAEIYECLILLTGWSDEIVARAKHLELLLESRLLHPRRDVIEFAKKAKRNGSRLIVTSDTYMPSDFLRTILASYGFQDLIDEIYVSCEVRARKDWGNIWEHLIKCEQIDKLGDKFIHIGDNEQSDVQQPCRKGIRSLGILNPGEICDLKGLTGPENWKYNLSTRWQETVSMGPVFSHIGNSPFIYQNSILESPFDFGYIIAGPILFGFIHWLCNVKSRQTESKQFSFMARDCFFVKKIYDVACTYLGKDEYLPSLYLKISRQSALSCLFDTPESVYDESRLDLLIKCGDFKGSVSDFLKARMGYVSQEAFDDLVIDNISEQSHYILDAMQSESHALVDFCSRNKRNLMKYFSRMQFDIKEPQCLVDVGYSATTQKILQIISGNQLDGAYLALNQNAASLAEFGNGGVASAFYGDQRNPDSPMGYIQAYSLIVESFLTAYHGKPVAYDDRGVPIKNQITESPLRKAFLDAAYNGALHYSLNLLNSYGPEVLFVDFSPADFLGPFADLVEGRISPSQSLWQSFIVEDDFCGNGSINALEIYGIK